jgi:hypothetical protein
VEDLLKRRTGTDAEDDTVLYIPSCEESHLMPLVLLHVLFADNLDQDSVPGT